MYLTVLTLHSWNRWLALALGSIATVNAFRQTPAVIDGRRRGSRWDTFFQMVIDLQVLFGLLLYFGLSPYSTEAMSDLGAAMKSPTLRFWGVEHEVLAFASVILVRLGRVFAVNGHAPESRRKRRLICFAAALILMIAAAFMERRPLFRDWPA
jgi:hypothetical protein